MLKCFPKLADVNIGTLFFFLVKNIVSNYNFSNTVRFFLLFLKMFSHYYLVLHKLEYATVDFSVYVSSSYLAQ